jgi:hypothetical protein
MSPRHLFIKPAAARRVPLLILLLLTPVLGADRTAGSDEVRLPVVPVRISQVVAQFQWSTRVTPPSPNVFVIEGSVMDGSDSLTIRQETILPGIVVEDQPGLVLLGVQWLWSKLPNSELEIEVLQPGQAPVAYRSIGIDERIGLLLTEPVESAPDRPLLTMSIRLKSRGSSPADTRLLCVPGEQSFRLVAARRTGSGTEPRLTPLTRTPLPPLLLPVLSLQGDFDGFCYPVAPLPDASREWAPVPPDDILRRARFIAENRINIQPGYLGVFLGDRSLENGQSQVYIRGIVPHSPSDAAGLRPGDIVRTVSGDPVFSAREMISRLRQYSPNTKIALNVLREGRPLMQQAILARPPASQATSMKMTMDAMRRIMEEQTSRLVIQPEGATDSPALASLRSTGVFIKTPSPQLLKALGQDAAAGALITYVLPGFPAARSGLQAGDLIVELNGIPVRSAEDVTRGLKKIPPRDPIILRFLRQGQSRQVTLHTGVEKAPR